MDHTNNDARLQQETQRILDTGLRNLWHPVAPSWQVGNAPVGVTRLNVATTYVLICGSIYR